MPFDTEPPGGESWEEVLTSQLPAIDRVVAYVARREHLSATEAEELSSSVRLKIIENDYAVLRKFRYLSSLKTYLATVTQRVFLDERNVRWGKWRPSAEAKRAGPLAIALESLLVRDGHTLDQACSILEMDPRVTTGRKEIEKLAELLPARVRRRQVDQDALADIPAPSSSADKAVVERERTEAGERAQRVLQQVMQGLAPQDQLILRLRFEHGLSTADIARAIQHDQRILYRRMQAILGSIRQVLEREGIQGPDVIALLGQPEFEIAGIFGEEMTKTVSPRPSI